MDTKIFVYNNTGAVLRLIIGDFEEMNTVRTLNEIQTCYVKLGEFAGRQFLQKRVTKTDLIFVNGVAYNLERSNVVHPVAVFGFSSRFFVELRLVQVTNILNNRINKIVDEESYMRNLQALVTGLMFDNFITPENEDRTDPRIRLGDLTTDDINREFALFKGKVFQILQKVASYTRGEFRLEKDTVNNLLYLNHRKFRDLTNEPYFPILTKLLKLHIFEQTLIYPNVYIDEYDEFVGDAISINRIEDLRPQTQPLLIFDILAEEQKGFFEYKKQFDLGDYFYYRIEYLNDSVSVQISKVEEIYARGVHSIHVTLSPLQEEGEDYATIY